MNDEEYIKIGKLNKKLFAEIGQKLITDEVIFTYERVRHIEEKREKLFDYVKDILSEIIHNPDYIYEDWNNRDNTLVLIKSLDEKSKLNVVLKIAIANDVKHTKNSIITVIKLGEKSFNKILRNKKSKLLFKN